MTQTAATALDRRASGEPLGLAIGIADKFPIII
jgi:hypothetical protein